MLYIWCVFSWLVVGVALGRLMVDWSGELVMV